LIYGVLTFNSSLGCTYATSRLVTSIP